MTKAKMAMGTASSRLPLTFEQPERKFQRARKMTIEELFEGFDGEYEPPVDWPLQGSEIDWGEPVGKEAWTSPPAHAENWENCASKT